MCGGDATDETVLREVFAENAYQLDPGDLNDTGVVIDIGGNIGAFSVYCAALGAKAVHTYEPDSRNWELLVANVAANDMGAVISPHKYGVSERPGTAELVQGQGASFLIGVQTPTLAAKRLMMKGVRETVEVLTLAQVHVTAGIAYCDVLKIDCEGSEPAIIAGAPPEVIAKARYIAMEFHAADVDTFGRMIAKLSLTHNLHLFGRQGAGGMVYGRRY
jgi:FkbM family methyltransferase